MSSFQEAKQTEQMSRTASTLTLAALVLGLATSAPAWAQQDPQQPDQSSAQDQSQQAPEVGKAPPPPQAPQQTPPDSRPKPKYASQDADKPPYAKDYPSHGQGQGTRGQAHAPSPDQYDPDQDAPPQDGSAPGDRSYPDNRSYNDQSPNGQPDYDRRDDRENDGQQQSAPRSTRRTVPLQPPPLTLTIPAGTIISVRINEYLSSDHNQVGDRVTATLQEPIVVSGWVVARRGQTLTGQVEAVQKAGRVKGTSQLGIELTDLTLVDGQQRPILTQLWKGSGGTTHGADAATIGGTTALGAAIGAAADWGRGAAIGAGAGAAAGIGAVLLTRGRPTVIPPETSLGFRLVDPVTVDTTQSQQAFLPVGQQDYDSGERGYRRAGRADGGYPQQNQPDNDCANDGPDGPCYVAPSAYPLYAYPGYGYYPGYFYPGYVGFGWGWGPRYYGRGYYGRGFHR